MSPRAAWRLAGLGYTSVFDYAAGEADWLAYGLPWDGTAQLIQPHVIRDVTTCHPDEPVTAVRQRLKNDPLDMVIIVNDTMWCSASSPQRPSKDATNTCPPAR